ncbi:MAG: MBL fold metallo-hydrolase [Gemmatimonadetes bacterium]|nr:MBL fold metallo-hydrolase [Gemmatimonadota bacterium]
MSVSITYWGTRGTVPTPGAQTARLGGNTACVEVQDGNGNLVILDAGTGIRSLGKHLLGRKETSGLRADIVLSHAHWDHIQGLPYFAPLFMKGNVLRVWGPKQGDVEMETILRQLMQPVVFPVPLDALAATLEVLHVNADPITTAGCTITSMRVRHPAVTLGYKLTMAGGRSVVYVTDDELGPGGDYDVGPNWRQRFVAFIGDADLLIHDAMYTPEEYDAHAGWGHSTFVEAVELAHEAGVKRLSLFHHDPEHSDDAMDVIVARAREEAGKKSGALEVCAAAEGMTIRL